MDENERGERNKNLRQFIANSRSKATQRKTDAYGFRFQEFVREKAQEVSIFYLLFTRFDWCIITFLEFYWVLKLIFYAHVLVLLLSYLV